MAGMDANLSIAAAKAQQERTCAGGNDQGPKTSKSKGTQGVCEKAPHQGK